MVLFVTVSTPVQVLEEYWKEWKMNEAKDGGLVKFRFSDDKEVQGMLSSQFGEGWKASLKADRVSGWAGVRGLLCDLVSCDCHVTACCPGVECRRCLSTSQTEGQGEPGMGSV